MLKLTLKEFTDDKLSLNRGPIIEKLNWIEKTMKGRPCYDSDLTLGHASTFLIYALQEYFDTILEQPFETYLEIGSLYVNDCAGASQVISCSGTTRSLENITIDGGSF